MSSLVDRSPMKHRDKLRICHIRAADSAVSTGLDAVGEPITTVMDLGSRAEFLEAATGLTPKIAAAAYGDNLRLSGQRSGEVLLEGWQRWLIDVAGGGLVDVRVMSCGFVDVASTVRLLEDLYYEHLEGEPTQWDSMSVELGLSTDSTKPHHQIVMLPASLDVPSWDLIQRLIYRADLEANPEYSSIARPDELNRRPQQSASVGSFGSVLWNQQHYVETGVVLSAALVVSAVESLRLSRAAAHQALRRLHSLSDRDVDVYSTSKARQNLRYELVDSHETISRLEAELTFGADASATITPLLPSLRVEAYHQALHQAVGVSQQTQLVDRMLARLRAGSEAELAALQSVEGGIAQLRTRRWSIAAQVLAGLTIPITLLLAYFGVSTNDVPEETSMFDVSHHWPAYLLTGLLVLGAASLLLVLWLIDRRRLHRSQRRLRAAADLGGLAP